ncbi:MAG: 4-alpha-glucanotransferase [Acidobacteria bacterium]|nr:4-alpha-glucanotransferase [Acidobacteriota bacterium]
MSTRKSVQRALDLLGIRNLLLGIHDAAFPSRDDEDLGRGTPYSEGAADFMAFVAEIGFRGVQLGPQGATSAGNPSPYDGTLFSRNPLSLALGPLTRPEWGELLPPEELARLVASRPGPRERVPHAWVHSALPAARASMWRRFQAKREGGSDPVVAPLSADLDEFARANSGWLARDGLYEALEHAHGGRHWREWADPERHAFDPPPGEEAAAARLLRELLAEHIDTVDSWAFAQFVLHRQHRELQQRARSLGLKLFGDLQVGLSPRDEWAAQAFRMRGYRMGAPPSRTNPEGQPWNHAVLDPARYFEARPDGTPGHGPALRFLRARMDKMFSELDGVRIDHPHGFVCPWVYRAEQNDANHAVQHGARLFSSPELPDHPELAPFAIARAEQLDYDVPRHADGWVKELDEEQEERYAILVDLIVEAADRHERGTRDIACEILSTQPYPLGRVMARHGLGRFRVTQRADLDEPGDGYRGENARTEDWIMVGNHDTRPIWLVAREWIESGESWNQARYLATRLLAPEEDREAWVRETAGNRNALVQAKLADLFVGPAANVLVFFTDALGLEDVYNRPGLVDDLNWSLRVSPSFRREHAERVARGAALDLPRVLARALRARGATFVTAHRGLLEELERA